MMTQEEYVDLLALSRQGKTIAEIADELGYHRATISKWLKEGGPPPRRAHRAGRSRDRCGLGGPHKRADPSAGREAARHERVRDHLGRGIQGQLPERRAVPAGSRGAPASGPPRPSACRSRRPLARSASSTGPTARTGRGAGASARCSASAPSCRGRVGRGGGSPTT